MNQDLPKRKKIQETQSPIEDILLRELHLLGIYPITQFQVGPYFIDLALPERMIAIECDGKEWHSTPEQKAKDKVREDFLKKNGWWVRRFTGSNIYQEAESLAKEIIGVWDRPRLDEIRTKKWPSKKEIEDESLLSGEELEDLCEARKRIAEEREDYEVRSFTVLGRAVYDRYKNNLV